MKEIVTTLLIVRQNDRLLLAKKKRGFGEGKINGCGVKCNEDELIYDAMKREALEELGIVPLDATEYGVIDFDEYVKGEKAKVEMHIFLATQFEGEPVETDEMMPCWVDADNIPFEKMFQDNKYWMPYLLAKQHFEGYFEYDEDFNIITQSIDVYQ